MASLFAKIEDLLVLVVKMLVAVVDSHNVLAQEATPCDGP